MNDTPTHDRLADELHAAARAVPLAAGSEHAVIARGRHRQRRRRRATALGLVATLGGGTAVGIRQLARTGDGSIATDQPTLPTATGSVPDTTATPPAPAPTTAPASEVAAAIPPAQIIDPYMVWNVIEPDSTEAVGMLEVGGDLPGIALSTAPGKSDEWVYQLWRSTDGVSWTPIDTEFPVANPGNARVRGDTIYVLGTAPGIARTEPNPLIVATTSDFGASWQTVELPFDTDSTDLPPFVVRRGANGTAYPVDGGVLVQASAWATWDEPALGALVGASPEGVANTAPAAGDDPTTTPPESVPGAGPGMQVTTDGVSVLDDPACDPVATTSDQLYPVQGTVTATTVAGGEHPWGDCAATLHTWAELGVPQESVDLVLGSRVPRWYFVADGADGIAAELSTPEPIYGADGGTSDEPLFASESGQHYTGGPDGFTPAPASADSGAGWPIGSNETAQFVARDVATAFSLYGASAIGASLDGGATWNYSRLETAIPTGRIGWVQNQVVTTAGLVSVLPSYADPIGAAGGLSVTSDGYTISRTDASSPVVIVDDASGSAVDLANVFTNDRGELVLTDGSGVEVARFSAEPFASVLWGGDLIGAGAPEWHLLTTPDGVHVAVESLADLLGVDDGDIASVMRMQGAGDTTVVAVSLTELHPDGSHKQVVLVGTRAG